MIKIVHPEALREVWLECKILQQKHLDLPGEVIWNMAAQFVYACCMADTALFMNRYHLRKDFGISK